MKNLIITVSLLFSILLLQAEGPKKEIIVSQMTKAELNACYKNREKTEQRFLIKQNGYTGFIDGCGRVVIEPVYDSALEFSEGLARVGKEGKFGFIDKSGKVVIDFYLDFAWYY
ncbi:WG repeat-containing protein [bacterium]|nr:WG repeat-containing protein [bacterium]